VPAAAPSGRTVAFSWLVRQRFDAGTAVPPDAAVEPVSLPGPLIVPSPEPSDAWPEPGFADDPEPFEAEPPDTCRPWLGDAPAVPPGAELEPGWDPEPEASPCDEPQPASSTAATATAASAYARPPGHQ
jgi:hypothetical protein